MSITTIMVQCAATFGTAFAIDGGVIVSAHHVFQDAECEFIGATVNKISSDANTDVFIGKSSDVPPSIQIPYSCKRMERGEVMTLHGSMAKTYAIAEGKTVMAHMDGAVVKVHKMFGEVFPGQSGGPAIDDDGFVRGIISGGDGGNLVTVVELADTPVCQG